MFSKVFKGLLRDLSKRYFIIETDIRGPILPQAVYMLELEHWRGRFKFGALGSIGRECRKWQLFVALITVGGAIW